MTNSRDPIEDIKNKLDIKDIVAEYVRLEKAGTNYKAPCPFHKEKTPSFFVSPARQLWRCFGCGEGGDMFTFVQSIEGVGFPEALRSLANKAGVEIKKQDPRIRSEKNKSLEICRLTAKYFQYQIESKSGKLVEEYLKDRGLSEKSISGFKLGYAPRNSRNFIKFLADKGFTHGDMEKAGVVLKLEGSGEYIGRFRGRIIFPIFDTAGNPIGFGGRAITEDLARKMGIPIKDDLAKYINSPQTNIYDKSRVLYGLSDAKLDIRREDSCVVVEGYTDVILAHQNGYKNVVASSGTALTEEQLNLIKRFTNNIFTSFDMDAAGDMATRRGITLAQQHGFNIRVIMLPKEKDPADIFAEGETKEWDKAVENAKSIMQFYFDSTFEKYDTPSAEDKRDAGKELAPILKSIPNRIEQSHWVKELATKLGVDID
ncbi:MAG: DNA primase, partial [Candidatus Spechtbacterales bacterium]